MKFKSVKGTRDILPPESYLWLKTEETVRGVMHRFNYREIRTPVFEETALFANADNDGLAEYPWEDEDVSSSVTHG